VIRRSLPVFIGMMIFACAAGFGQTRNQDPPQPPASSRVEAPKVIPGAGGSASDSALPIDPKTYVIGAEDILFIRVWRENDYTGAVAVRPDGKITIPLVGDVQAADLTPERLSTQLKQALAEYINNPEVTVTITQVNSKKFSITGEVNRPGTYPLVVSTKVFEALNSAGGFRDFANKKDIIIIRSNGQRLRFNYNDYVKGKNLDKNVDLLNGDTILVK
jgi:polysaccharide export outer membrane protein